MYPPQTHSAASCRRTQIALDDYIAQLGHHYRSSNNVAKTIEYLVLAGEQAVRRGTYAQALANVEPALRFIEQLPRAGGPTAR
jgi:hypothetical protein